MINQKRLNSESLLDTSSLDSYNGLIESLKKVSDKDIKVIRDINNKLSDIVKLPDIEMFLVKPVKAQDRLAITLKDVPLTGIVKLISPTIKNLFDINLKDSLSKGTFVPNSFGLVLIKMLNHKMLVQKHVAFGDEEPDKEWNEFEKVNTIRLNKLKKLWDTNQIVTAIVRTLKHVIYVIKTTISLDIDIAKHVPEYKLLNVLFNTCTILMCAMLGEFVYDMSVSLGK